MDDIHENDILKMKPIIICIVGESGVGKTYVANYLEDKHGIPMIESRTTRPPRYEGERGHTFISEEEFKSYREEDMIAFTQFGKYNYCCLISNVPDSQSCYVIDEFGLLYLRENFSDKFTIFAIRMFATDHLRERHVSKERMERDKGKFTLDQTHFDAYLDNTYDDKTQKKVDHLLSRLLNQPLCQHQTKD